MKLKMALIVNGLVLPFSIVYASTSAQPTTTVHTPSAFESISYMPQVYLAGYAGSNIMGQADVLMPLHFTNKNIFFGYLQSRVQDPEHSYENTPWSASFGLGYRQIISKETLLGGYLFGDYSRTESGHDISVISPGFEALGRVWDARINGYFPVSDKSWESGNWADYYNDYHWNRFEGHNQYDHWYTFKEETGNGVDAEIGRKLVKLHNVLIKAYVGGYYYGMQDNDDITGVSLKLTAQPTKSLTFYVTDTYDDTYNNVFMFGVKVRINDFFNHKDSTVDEDDLSERLIDSIDRNLVANGKGAVAPTNMGGPYDKGEGLEHDNVWFFDNDKTTNGDGTYENPFNEDQYTQTTIDQIYATDPAYAYMYFDPGVFSDGSITLYNNQSMWGRTEDYTAPAVGDARPVIDGQLILPGDNIIDSMIISYDPDNLYLNSDLMGTYNAAVNISGSNVTLSNAVVNANGTSGAYTTGIRIADNIKNTNIINSDVIVSQDGTATSNNSFFVTGIDMGENSELTLDNSNVRATADVAMQEPYENVGTAIGIHAAGVYDVLNVQNNSSIKATSDIDITQNATSNETNASYSMLGNSYGILMGTPTYLLNAEDASNLATDEVIDLSVHDNALNIAASSVISNSYITVHNTVDNTTSTLSYSNNSNAILVGDGLILNNSTTSTTDPTSINAAVYNNTISVAADSDIKANSDLYSDNYTMLSTNYSSYSNGILFGVNSAMNTGSNADLSVDNNNLTVDNSYIDASSAIIAEKAVSLINQSIYANAIIFGGNSYTESIDNAGVQSEVANNTVNVNNSTLNTISSLNSNYINTNNTPFYQQGINYSDYSNDVMIGRNFESRSSVTNPATPFDSSTNNNAITISCSSLSSQSLLDFTDDITDRTYASLIIQDSNDSNGILIGANYRSITSGNPAPTESDVAYTGDVSSYNNSVNVSSSTINTLSSLDAFLDPISATDSASTVENFSGNSNSIVIGGNSTNEYAYIDASIHDNNIQATNATLNATATSTIDITSTEVSPTIVMNYSRNTNDILLGETAVESIANNNIYDNQIAVADSELNADSTYNVNNGSFNMFNGYANSSNITIGGNFLSIPSTPSNTLLGNIYGNQINVSNSALTATSKINLQSDAEITLYDIGQNSALSTNILIGYDLIYATAYAGDSIDNNNIDIDNSMLDANSFIGIDNDQIGYIFLTDTGNSSSIFIGRNSANIANNTDSSVNSTINNNDVTINNSYLSATSNLNTNNNLTLLYSNLSSAILIGNNSSDYGSDISVFDNSLTIDSSILNAKSDILSGDQSNIMYSGNASDILLGGNYLGIYDTSTYGKANIHDNTVTVNNSILDAAATLSGGNVISSGNSYNVFMGYGEVKYQPSPLPVDTDNLEISTSDSFAIYNNNLTITNSVLNSASDLEHTNSYEANSGNANGIYLGYNNIYQYPIPTNGVLANDIYGNNINVTDSIFNITATGDTYSGSAYGINFGENGTYNTSLQPNAITATCNTFNIGSTTGDSWGIYVHDLGTPTATVLNANALDSNLFYQLFGSPSNGGKISWPNGTVNPW